MAKLIKSLIKNRLSKSSSSKTNSESINGLERFAEDYITYNDFSHLN